MKVLPGIRHAYNGDMEASSRSTLSLAFQEEAKHQSVLFREFVGMLLRHEILHQNRKLSCDSFQNFKSSDATHALWYRTIFKSRAQSCLYPHLKQSSSVISHDSDTSDAMQAVHLNVIAQPSSREHRPADLSCRGPALHIPHAHRPWR